jgi:catechol 2,3-dioxygenase-like lactoylglutathione lyase family enzyme
VSTCACCENAAGLIRLWSDKDLVVCYDCLDWMNDQRAKQMAAPGSPVRVVGYEPIFRVADVDRAVDHYQRLGFSTDYHDATYAFAHLGQLTLHLAHDDDDPHQTGVLYIHVDDADQLGENWRAAGLEVTGPENQDYGKREGRHVDPDGNVIRFGSPIRN